MSAFKGSLGAAMAVTSALLFAATAIAAKVVYEDGVSPGFYVILRSAVTVAAIGAFQIAALGGVRVVRGERGAVFIYAVGSACISYGYMSALAFIPASSAVLIFYLYPILTVITSALHQRTWPSALNIAAIAAAFFGLFLVLGADVQGLNWQGVSLGLLAAFGATALLHASPRLIKAGGAVAGAFTGMLWALPLVAAAGFALDDIAPPMSAQSWWIMLAAGLGFGAGMMLLMGAVRRAGPARAAVLFNCEPVFVVILALVLFGEDLTARQWAGAALVIAAVMAVAARGGKAKDPAEHQAGEDAAKP